MDEKEIRSTNRINERELLERRLNRVWKRKSREIKSRGIELALSALYKLSKVNLEDGKTYERVRSKYGDTGVDRMRQIKNYVKNYNEKDLVQYIKGRLWFPDYGLNEKKS